MAKIIRWHEPSHLTDPPNVALQKTENKAQGGCRKGRTCSFLSLSEPTVLDRIGHLYQ